MFDPCLYYSARVSLIFPLVIWHNVHDDMGRGCSGAVLIRRYRT